MKKTEVSDNFLENTLRVVCQQCGFTFGEQQDPDEFFQCSILQNVLAKNNITCLVKFSKQFKCITCLKAGETEFFKQIILRLPLFDTIDDGHSLSKYIEQFMRANECKYCVFCRKVRNHKTCAAFMSFPNLLVVNLARNVDTVKCGKKVSLSRYVQIKGKDCSDLDAMYELVSVVVHLGEKVEGGHFVCYFFLNGNDIIEINDQSVRKLDLSQVKTVLEKNGYLFFYKKQTDNNSSDCTYEEHNYCKKRKKIFVKRPKITAVESSFDTQPTIKRRYIDYKPRYYVLDNQWEALHQENLQFVIDNLREIISFSVTKNECNKKYYRHIMFLKSGEKTLFACNKRFDYTFYKFTPEFVLDFFNCIRKKLCLQVETVKMFGDDIYSKFTVGTLVFKRTAVQPSNELEKDLNINYSGSCNEYMKLVIDMEAIIYYVMFRYNVDYSKASHNLKLEVEN